MLAFFRPRDTKPATPLDGSFSLAAAATISAIDFGYSTPFWAKSSSL